MQGWWRTLIKLIPTIGWKNNRLANLKELESLRCLPVLIGNLNPCGWLTVIWEEPVQSLLMDMLRHCQWGQLVFSMRLGMIGRSGIINRNSFSVSFCCARIYLCNDYFFFF